MTVTERFATSRYYCLMPVHARGGLTVTAEMQAYSEDAEMTFEVYARGWLLTGKALYFFTLLQTGSGSVILYPNY